MSKLLIIDDEPIIRKLLAKMMELEGYEVFQAEDFHTGMSQLKKNHPQVVLCDVFLPDGNGVELLPKMKECAPDSEIVMLTAHGNIEDGVKAIKNGAFDYITKGDDNNKIIPIISRAMDKAGDHQTLKKKTTNYTFDSIIGSSPGIQSSIQLARKVAVTDVSVLLTGETGTGKEVFAQAIHSGSNRRAYPFVALNCSAFSRDLLESELFGYKAGAFTGAMKEKKGLFEIANHGTLFLDEIGEMSYDLQAKLLRVLETGEYFMIGGTTPTEVDVRIISATNEDLPKEIAKGNFREDLFYRLSVFQIHLPPLRERQEDIIPLAKLFLARYSKKLNKKIEGISPSFIHALRKAEWRGNVRELKNVIERSCIVCDGKLTSEDLPMELQVYQDSDGSHADTMDLAAVEHRHIARVLAYAKGNKTKAARLLKIGLTTLYRKIEEYHIDNSFSN